MDNAAVAKRIAEEAIVLLKNEKQLLPFSKGQKAAFFGRAQIDTIIQEMVRGLPACRVVRIY